MEEARAEISLPLVRGTVLWAHGRVGGLTVRDESGKDVTKETRQQVGPGKFDAFSRCAELELERAILRGPTDEELPELAELAARGYDAQAALAVRKDRLAFEQQTTNLLQTYPEWRRGRLRDYISAREFTQEWLSMINLVQQQRAADGKAQISDQLMTTVMAGMPQAQVAISMKTRYHHNARHEWTVNDITDIDAMAVAYAYCECLLTDNAARANLDASKELRQLGAALPRTPADLSAWLEGLPRLARPWRLVPAGSTGRIAACRPMPLDVPVTSATVMSETLRRRFKPWSD